MKNEFQVIVVGADCHNEWAKDVYLAFREFGVDTELVYTNTLFGGMDSSTSVTARAFLEVFKNFFRLHANFFFEFIKRIRRWMSERTLVNRMASFRKPGKKMLVIFIWTPPSVSILKKLKKKNLVLVLWQGEPPVRDLGWARSFPYFDHIFFVDEEWIPLFAEELRGKTSFLLLSSSATKHFPLKKAECGGFSADIAFVGCYRKERAETLSILKDHDLKIYGYWWEPGMGQFPWLKEKYRGPVSNEDANRIFNSAKIAIGALPIPVEFSHVVTQRVFDISLAGNFQLSGYTPAIPKIFGDSVPMFRNKEELGEKVDYYLAHPEERERLAAKAHAIAMKEHTYANRIKTMLEVLGIKQ